MKAEKGKTILYSPIGKDPIVVSLDRAEFLKSIGWTEKDRSASVSKTKINKQNFPILDLNECGISSYIKIL